MTEITSSINSRVRLWKINHSGPGCNFTYLGYSEKCFTRIYRALYGDATLLPIRMGTNMAAKNQQKHLSMSSTSTVWIIQVRDKLVSRGSHRHLSNNSSNKRTVQICSDSKISQNESLLNLHDRSLGHHVNAASCESLESAVILLPRRPILRTWRKKN